MEIEVKRQGNEYVVVPVGQSPLKFATENELAAWIASQHVDDTHPQGQPTLQPQASKLPEPTETTPEAKGKPHNRKPTTKR